MTKKLLVVLVALAIVFSAKVYGEEKAPKQAKPVKAPRVVETRLSETDMGRIERAISKGAISKQGTIAWEYMARKMKPPKNDKWTEKWNEVGKDGWEAFDHFENVYLFKRPAFSNVSSSSTMKAAPVEPAIEPTDVKPAPTPAEQPKVKAPKKHPKAE